MEQYCRAHERLRWMGDVILGLAYSGMRVGELAQLRWSAVHLERNVICVVDDSRSWATHRGKACTTKSGKSRLVPIHAKLRAVLERLHQTDREGPVFRALRGGPLRSRNVLQVFIDDVIEPLKHQIPSADGE